MSAAAIVVGRETARGLAGGIMVENQIFFNGRYVTKQLFFRI
jgi:hypothetical protein